MIDFNDLVPKPVAPRAPIDFNDLIPEKVGALDAIGETATAVAEPMPQLMPGAAAEVGPAVPEIRRPEIFDPAEHPIAGREFRGSAVERGAVAAARQLGITKLLPVEEVGLAEGAAVPSPEELAQMKWYRKFPEYAGMAGAEIIKLVALHSGLKAIGVVGRLPAHPSVLQKAGEMARWFGGAEAIEQMGRRVGEQVLPEIDFHYRPQNILTNAAIGGILSLGLSGVGVLGKKLFIPSEKRLALRVLGLKKGATDAQISKAMKGLGQRVRNGDISSKEEKLIKSLHERWLKRQPDIVYRTARPKPRPLLPGPTEPTPTVRKPPIVTPTAPKGEVVAPTEAPKPKIEPKVTPTKPLRESAKKTAMPKGIKVGDIFKEAGQTWEVKGMGRATGGDIGIRAETERGQRGTFDIELIQQKLAHPPAPKAEGKQGALAKAGVGAKWLTKNVRYENEVMSEQEYLRRLITDKYTITDEPKQGLDKYRAEKGDDTYTLTKQEFDYLKRQAENAKEKPKEIKPHEKEEAIAEPPTSLEVEPKEAGELVPTGQLDPANYEDALEITRLHANWVAYDKARPAWEGIYSTKWDKEKGGDVKDVIDYSREEVDTAYRTVQKSIPSPMPDTKLLAMPGKENELKTIGNKMSKLPRLPRKTTQKARLPKPKALPKAKTSKEDSIKAVFKAANVETTRYAINGVLIEGDTIVATDGRRMFWAKGKWGKDGVYLNAASLKKGVLGKADKKQKFPAWKDIVPDVSGEKPIVVTDLERVWRHARQAESITSEESRGIVIIANKDGSLGFAGAAADVGHAEINIQPGGRILGAVNPDYFLDMIAFHTTRGDTSFEFYFPEWDRAMYSRSPDGKTFTMTMPINVGTERAMSEAIAEAIAEGKPGEPPKGMRPKGRPGKLNIEPLVSAAKHLTHWLEPQKFAQRKVGKGPIAAVMRGTFGKRARAEIDFGTKNIPLLDKSINELEAELRKFPDKDLDNLMLTRGEPDSIRAQGIQQAAMDDLPPGLKGPKFRQAIQEIADMNLEYLRSVLGQDIKKFKDYYYGIYKAPKAAIDKFLDSWMTTKRYIKEKKFPTYADAKAAGFDIKNPNPIANLKSEYAAIAHLDGMIWLKNELLRTGDEKFIWNAAIAPPDSAHVHDWTFNDVRLEPELAGLINGLISTNKISMNPTTNKLREVNNFLRTIKFIGSAFHMVSIAKQSIADSGYLGFLMPQRWVGFHRRPGKFLPVGVHKNTAALGITLGFRKNDPIFKTEQYKRYIENGGEHRSSMESQARRAFNNVVRQLNKNMGLAIKAGALPLQIPTRFVNWMFESYIPKVKYAKTLSEWQKKEKKLGRELKDWELQEIIKEGQNFYGMMNERLFGRTGTATSSLRLVFMAPSYAEGNYRSILKAVLQWGFGPEGWKSSRSRSNIVNSLLLSGIAATIGTMILTGKRRKLPTNEDEMRDLFKIDTGETDEKGRRIMIDLLTYDKDYWNVAIKTLMLKPGEALDNSIRRVGGMKATTFDIAVDLAHMALGRAIYDWKGDTVYYTHDPFLEKVMKTVVHEVRKMKPISVSVYQQSRRRGIDKTIAAVETLAGVRPSRTEANIKEGKLLSDLYSLRGEREELSYVIGKSSDPMGLVRKYNQAVRDILDNPITKPAMRQYWEPKLLIKEDTVVLWKRYPVSAMSDTEVKRAFSNTRLKTKSYVTGRSAGQPKKGYEDRYEELKAEIKKRGL